MDTCNQMEIVKKQYQSAVNLNTRISIHDKYSTNKTGFGNWIFSQYTFFPGCRILELGCGTGMQWEGKDRAVSECARLVLSDFSDGMIAAAQKNLKSYTTIEYQQIDIQHIPFSDESFDRVMANMMLYHVPDIAQALREVRRVLVPGGTFYCATYGENGISAYLAELLRPYGMAGAANTAFTLQNGAHWLGAAFRHVERLDYADSLAVNDIDDFVDYIYSLPSMSALSPDVRGALHAELEKRTVGGVLTVPKEYGLFVCH